LIDGDDEEGEGGEGGQASAAPEPAAPDAEPIADGTNGPQMRIVDGNIVVDESSMQVDRQRIAQGQQGELVEVRENEFSKIVTCGTHMKREKAQLWDMAANEIFLESLKMFGTDFESIAKMFPIATADRSNSNLEKKRKTTQLSSIGF